MDDATRLLDFKIIQTSVETMSEADNVFLHVHLDDMQVKSWLHDNF